MIGNIYTRICYLMFIVLMLVCYRFYVNYFFLILVIVMIIFPVLSLAALFYYRDRLRLTIIAPDRVERGQEITIRVRMENTGVLPIVRSMISLNIENTFYNQAETYYLCCGIPAGKYSEASVNIRSDYCGAINLSTGQAEIWDYSGMFSKKLSIHENAVMNVIAQSVEVEISTEAIGGAGLTELVEQDAKGNDSSTIIDTRDYLPGDKPNRIHWKLSTKLDKLIVKEYGSISSNDVLVLINLYKKEASGIPEKQRDENLYFDSIFDAYMTLLKHLLSQKRPFSLAWYCPGAGELKKEDVTSFEEGVSVLSQIYFEATSDNPCASLDICKKTMDEYGEFIYITPGYTQSIEPDAPGEELFSVIKNSRVLAKCYWMH